MASSVRINALGQRPGCERHEHPVRWTRSWAEEAGTLLNDNNPNNDAAACGKLHAFVNQVDAKEKSGKLTAAQVEELRQAASAIRASAGCP